MDKMKSLLLALVLLLAVLTVGCDVDADSFYTSNTTFPEFEQCNVLIKDRLTGTHYYTSQGFYMRMDSSTIKLSEYYVWYGSAFQMYEYSNETIYLSGNWSLIVPTEE